MNRKRMIIIYGLLYLVFVIGLVFGLKEKKKNFNNTVLKELVNDSSKLMSKVTDLCQVQLLGEPKVGKNYVKVNISCLNGSKAMSTLDLNAFEDKSIFGILSEYGKIVNYQGKLPGNSNWNCKINGLEVNDKNGSDQIQEASTIDCLQIK